MFLKRFFFLEAKNALFEKTCSNASLCGIGLNSILTFHLQHCITFKITTLIKRQFDQI